MKNIYILGYMGSGKSTIGPLLASQLSYDFLDFDSYIERNENKTIPEIFKTNGEIYFRKIETLYLKELLDTNGRPKVIALGGGTPCYGNNMELLKISDVITVYLNLSFKILAERLWKNKSRRPLIASLKSYDELEDYVRKHLFERSYYYNQADFVYKIALESPETLALNMKKDLF